MTKFIKLTEVLANRAIIPLILNINCIQSIKTSEKSTDTHIYMTNSKYYFVKEVVDEIWAKLNIDTTPVLMTSVEALEYYKLRDGT